MTAADVLREARSSGLMVSVAQSGNLYVEPAERLTPELHALLAVHKTELLAHLRQVEAADGHGAGVRKSPATRSKFARASPDLDRTIAEAGSTGDPDCDCYPNDPSPGAAMNTVELELFGRRHSRLLALGFTDDNADRMADKLKVRDREGDDRVSCAECRYAHAQTCPSGSPLPLALLHRCMHVRSAWASLPLVEVFFWRYPHRAAFAPACRNCTICCLQENAGPPFGRRYQDQ